MGIETALLHDYPVLDSHTGAASIPIYQTSTFHNRKLYGQKQKYQYSRFSNPTRDALEAGMATLEKSKHALVFSSGMAAISSVLMLLEAGDHLILPKEVYGGTCQFVTEILPHYGIRYSFVDMTDLEAVKALICPKTRMIYLETPSNPLLKVTDLQALVALANAKNILTVADNTFMTALYQNPLALGVDIVCESLTKFVNGHSDVVAGMVATNDDQIYARLQLYQKNFGAVLGIQDTWLILRGMKTLGIRMAKAVKNAETIAAFLAKHPKVKKLYYPTIGDAETCQIQAKQAANGGAVLSFELEDKEALQSFTEKMTIPILAVSLGGVESIISHPATMSHACLTPEERAEQGVSDTLLRLSCGIEDSEDLIADLKQALADEDDGKELECTKSQIG